jgi:hypothetical protein
LFFVRLGADHSQKKNNPTRPSPLFSAAKPPFYIPKF